jgi:hypothetical protein
MKVLLLRAFSVYKESTKRFLSLQVPKSFLNLSSKEQHPSLKYQENCLQLEVSRDCSFLKKYQEMFLIFGDGDGNSGLARSLSSALSLF